MFNGKKPDGAGDGPVSPAERKNDGPGKAKNKYEHEELELSEIEDRYS